MVSPLHAGTYLLLAVLSFVAITRRRRARSIAQLPGPIPRSWLAGNLPEILTPANVGDADFAWTEKFGTVMTLKGAFGADVLFTADSKALHYILNTSGYDYPKLVASLSLLLGKGVACAKGEQHARHRKVMNPAFSSGAFKTFLPLFRSTAKKTVIKLRDIVVQSGGTSCVIDIPMWMTRTALDAMGAAAFDYDFGALDQGNDNELSNAYQNLFTDVFFDRSDFTLAFQALWEYIPDWLIVVIQRIPTKQLKKLRKYMKVARRVAKSIVDRQVESNAAGMEGGKDVMSILVRANLSEDPKRKLSEDEILSQLTTLMLAGHETIASTINWILYELSRHPEFQKAVRDEIKSTRDKAALRGDGELSVADLDSMQCMHALIKETLRYHPIVPLLEREAGRDDMIPLAMPQTTITGQTITGVPVRKGQHIMMSVAAYNRLPDVWGKDADTWRAERFLQGVESTQKTGVGVFGNVATFSSGVRSCIGWRFAVIEMQAMLTELVDNFEFSPPPGNVEIVRAATGIMSPMIKGSSSAQVELPLTITRVMQHT